MTLTVPRSNRDPGRAAQINVPTPDTGGAIAGFGDAMARLGSLVTREQEGRALGRAKLDFQRGLNDLDLEMRQTNDPDVIDREFPQRLANLRTQIAGTLPDHLRERAGMELEALAQPREFAMGRQALELRQSYSRTMLADFQTETIRAASGLDPEGRAEQLVAFVNTVQERLDAGVLSPEEARKTVLDMQSSMDTAAARLLLRDDPETLRAQLDAGQLFGFDEEKRQSWLTTTASAIEAERKTLEVIAEREAKERDRIIGAELADAAKILKAGQVPDRLDELAQSEEYRSHPAAEEFGQALMLFEQRPDFLKAPPAVMRQMLQAEIARPKRSAGELDITAAMRDALAQAEKTWREDPITASLDLGLGVPPALPDDPASADADELTRALIQRAHYADSLVGTDSAPGWVDTPSLFSKAEREQFTKLADPSAPPPQRARLAAAFANAFGPDTLDRIGEVGGDPLFAYVGGMVANGGNERLARDIFEGQRAIASKDVPLPPETARRQTWFANFDGLFDNELEAGMRDQIAAAADALYAYRSRGDAANAATTIKATKYKQAVHEVLGGTGNYDAGMFSRSKPRGGVQPINNRLTLLPPDVAGVDVERAWVTAAQEMFFAGDYNERGELVPEQTQAALQALSVNGTAPSYGGQPMTANTWQKSSIRAVGPGTYALVYDHPELGETLAFDDNGDPWLLDLSRLLEMGQK